MLSRQRALAKRIYFLGLAALAPSAERRCWASAKLEELDFRSSVALPFPHPGTPASLRRRSWWPCTAAAMSAWGFLEVYNRHDPTRPVTQHLHLREFEAPMCGALDCTGLSGTNWPNILQPHTEVVVYRSPHELLDKVRFYLAHPAAAERCAPGRDAACTPGAYLPPPISKPLPQPGLAVIQDAHRQRRHPYLQSG
jgi:hypothetical protein